MYGYSGWGRGIELFMFDAWCNFLLVYELNNAMTCSKVQHLYRSWQTVLCSVYLLLFSVNQSKKMNKFGNRCDAVAFRLCGCLYVSGVHNKWWWVFLCVCVCKAVCWWDDQAVGTPSTQKYYWLFFMLPITTCVCVRARAWSSMQCVGWPGNELSWRPKSQWWLKSKLTLPTLLWLLIIFYFSAELYELLTLQNLVVHHHKVECLVKDWIAVLKVAW